jgi:hypothetical protein
MDSGQPPLHLRLVSVKIGRTKMWLLTSVCEAQQLPRKQIVRFYKMRWGIEIEFRGLKQTIDKHTLRCRDAARLLVELDWSLRGMAVAELLALREQLAAAQAKRRSAKYDPSDRSLANTMRAIRRSLQQLNQYHTSDDDLLHHLAQAQVQHYHNRTDKRARYRPKNPDKKPLGEPTIRKLTAQEREKLTKHQPSSAA